MLLFLYLVFLCSNFLFIKSEGTGYVSIIVDPGYDCKLSDNYTFTEGEKVTLVVKPKKHINLGWWRLKHGTDSRTLSDDMKTKVTKKQRNSDHEETPPAPTSHTAVVNKSIEGIWEFEFYLLKDNENFFQQNPNAVKKTYPDANGHFYVVSMCSTNVTIVTPAPAANKSPAADNTLIIACVVGSILVAIIIAQTAYIFFLKAKAQKLITLNTHNNLSKKSDAVPDDTARYCSNPGQKMMKVPTPVDNDNRDSVIYEAPNIEISSNPRMSMQPPQPPAITTMPRTPRPDHNRRIGPQAMLASALNSPARSPMSENFSSTFQRPNHVEREHSVANRPRLPLPNSLHNTPHSIPQHNPHDHGSQEVYEEMENVEENTYEPPPIINGMPPRLPMPPKKVPTGNLLDVKENTPKLRQGNKPPVTPKPQRPRSNIMIPPNELIEQAHRRRNDTMPKPTMTPMQQELAMRRRPIGEAQTNELEEALKRRNNGEARTNELEDALRRRNNVMHVPIVSIPDPSSRQSPKPRPPPSKPKGQPIQHPVQEEIYYNENQASSDEEWTYEPLKPLNIMQMPIPDTSSREPPKPRPPPSKPRGPPIPHPVQEEIYYNENQASSDEEWIYEPLKPYNIYDTNI